MKLSPATLGGCIAAIPSKSAAHRLFIAASLADQTSHWALPTSSVDIDTTLSCMQALGANIDRHDTEVHITPIQVVNTQPTIDCQESGSTLRFLLPVCAALGTASLFESTPAFAEEGTYVPAEVDLSSQYLTGLLLAAPLLNEDLDIHLTTPLQSRPYIDLTIDVLHQFGVEVTVNGNHFHVDADAAYRLPKTPLSIEGDWSNAAFFLAAGALSAPVTMTGLKFDSSQGDKAIVELLRGFGAKVNITDDTVTVAPAPLHAQTISVKEIPDALPILAVIAAQAEGTTVFTDAERLRLKESDRIATTSALLSALGVPCESDASSLRVTGVQQLHGNVTVDSANDHRIAMAAAIAALNCDAPIILNGASAVNKSYPHFFNDYNSLGGDASGI